MTEVPDKQTEGTGRRSWSRPGPRTRSARRAPSRSRRPSRPVADATRAGAPAVAAASPAARHDGGLVALPGERLSRAAGALTEADLAAGRGLHPRRPTTSAVEPSPARRPIGRRRRRSRAAAAAVAVVAVAVAAVVARTRLGRGRRAAGTADRRPSSSSVDIERRGARGRSRRGPAAAPRRPRSARSGTRSSGRPHRRPRPAPFGRSRDDEDFDEPEIPEYLIAEQRRGATRRCAAAAGGARGGRAAYQSAIERERYGRGGGGGGINRYPDVSGRDPGRRRAPGPLVRPRPSARDGRERQPGSGPAPRHRRAVERGPARARGHAPGAGRQKPGRVADRLGRGG